MSTVYRPIDVLDKQVDQVRFWRTSRRRHGFVDAFDFMINMYQATADQPLDMFLADRLDTAETFFVRSNIIQHLWDFADVHEAHEHEAVLPHDLPCARGFIWLENCIHIFDARGQICSIRAIMWSEEVGGVAITQFTDPQDDMDEINEALSPEDKRLTGDLSLLHIMPWNWGRKIQNLTVADFSLEKTTGGYIRDAEEQALVEAHMPQATDYMNRFNKFLLSLWEFVQEQIPYRVSPDRAMRKRLLRAHSPLKEVTVVELRPYDQPYEPSDPDHVPQTIVWSHRWRSRGHKRRWIDKHGNYRETTVSASIKGPEHLPLIEKDRVYHVKR